MVLLWVAHRSQDRAALRKVIEDLFLPYRYFFRHD